MTERMILSRFRDVNLAQGCLERLSDCDLDIEIKAVADGEWIIRGGEKIILSQAEIVRFTLWAPVIKTDSGEVEALPGRGRILIMGYDD